MLYEVITLPGAIFLEKRFKNCKALSHCVRAHYELGKEVLLPVESVTNFCYCRNEIVINNGLGLDAADKS